MTSPPTLAWLTNEIFELFDETFDRVQGNYLDRGTSLFETLATISAAAASRPVSARCASIAGQVDHVRFYLDTIQGYMQGTITGKTDWRQSWAVTDVTPEEWDVLKQRLRDSYTSVVDMLRAYDAEAWQAEVSGSLAMLVHTAYHLGEIRQALCTIQP